MSRDMTWVAEGLRAAEFNTRGSTNTVRWVTIERLTPTQIITSNERRYDRTTGKARGVNGIELRPVDDEGVVNAIALKRVEGLRYELDQLCKGFRGGEQAAYALLTRLGDAVEAARGDIMNPTRTAL